MTQVKYNARRVILTDCDGVLLDWEVAFHNWMERRGYSKENPGYYSMNHVYGINQKETKRLITEFNNSSAISELPTFRDARTGVATLLDAGYTFVCITSLSLDPDSRKDRIRNLNDRFGVDAFDDVICLDTGADKDEILAEFSYDNFWWIEDKWENAVEGLNHGLRPILINHDHNQGRVEPGVFRAETWKDITAKILEN